MVYLEEKVSKKVSGETSLFISFKYNERVVTALKNIGGCVYYPKEKMWESGQHMVQVMSLIGLARK